MDEDAARQAYKTERAKEVEFEKKLVDSIQESVRNTEWQPPNGILKEVLVVMTFVDDDGDHMTCWVSNAGKLTADGMARRVTRDVERTEHLGALRVFMADEED